MNNLNERALEAAIDWHNRHVGDGLTGTEKGVLIGFTTAYLSASLPADAAELVERLRGPLAISGEHRDEAASLIQSQAAEIARCHARLGIDHEFVLHPDRPTDTVDDLVRVEIPMVDRINAIDGIEARDATIKGQDQQIDAMRARIAELEAFVEKARDFARESEDDGFYHVADALLNRRAPSDD